MRSLALVVLLGGCSSRVCWFGTCVSDGEPDAEPTTTSSPAPTTTPPTTADPTPTPTLPTDCPPDSPHTWESTGGPFVRSYCLGCHSSLLGVGERGGAPLGVDLDNLEDVRTWAVQVEVEVVGPDPTMPPAGGPTALELAGFAEWLACDLPGDGETDVGGPCDGAPVVAASAIAGCDNGPVIADGDLALADDGLGACLCAVQGGLTVATGGTFDLLHTVDGPLTIGELPTPSALSFPALDTVAGDLSVAAGAPDSLALPALDNVQGHLTVTEAAELSSLVATRLRFVGGEMTFSQLDGLTSVDLFSLDEVALGVEITGTAQLDTFSLRSLATVGTHVSITENAGLTIIDDWGSLTNVPGDLYIRDNPELQIVSGFETLERVGGVFSISFDERLESIEGFPALVAVGELIVREDPALVALTAFDALREAGAVRLRALTSLEELRGLRQLDEVTGELTVDDDPVLHTLRLPVTDVGALDIHDAGLTELRLDDLEHAADVNLAALPELELLDLKRLSEVDQHVSLVRLGRVDALDGLGDLETVGGDLVIGSNPWLTTLDGLRALTGVGGSLSIVSNAALPDADAWAFVDGVTVLGDVEIRDNGG